MNTTTQFFQSLQILIVYSQKEDNFSPMMSIAEAWVNSEGTGSKRLMLKIDIDSFKEHDFLLSHLAVKEYPSIAFC